MGAIPERPSDSARQNAWRSRPSAEICPSPVTTTRRPTMASDLADGAFVHAGARQHERVSTLEADFVGTSSQLVGEAEGQPLLSRAELPGHRLTIGEIVADLGSRPGAHGSSLPRQHGGRRLLQRQQRMGMDVARAAENEAVVVEDRPLGPKDGSYGPRHLAVDTEPVQRLGESRKRDLHVELGAGALPAIVQHTAAAPDIGISVQLDDQRTGRELSPVPLQRHTVGDPGREIRDVELQCIPRHACLRPSLHRTSTVCSRTTPVRPEQRTRRFAPRTDRRSRLLRNVLGTGRVLLGAGRRLDVRSGRAPWLVFVLVTLLVGQVEGAGAGWERLFVPKADLWPRWQQHDAADTRMIDHGAWETLLGRYVDTKHPSGINRMNYRAVTVDDRRGLDDYLRRLESA